MTPLESFLKLTLIMIQDRGSFKHHNSMLKIKEKLKMNLIKLKKSIVKLHNNFFNLAEAPISAYDSEEMDDMVLGEDNDSDARLLSMQKALCDTKPQSTLSAIKGSPKRKALKQRNNMAPKKAGSKYVLVLKQKYRELRFDRIEFAA